MKTALILAIGALMVPSVALAAKPGPSGPAVMYILTGKLSAYDPNPNGGCITIVVTDSNYRAGALKGQALTFPVDASTKISLANGLNTITDNDTGTIKIQAGKDISSLDLDWMLQATTAGQVVDAGQ
jgi:hypothetical protein